MVEMSISCNWSTDLNSPISFETSNILLVIVSGAGPPLAQLYLMPKSASMPPGLCEAVNKMPPSACCFRTIADKAGVDKIPSEVGK